MTEEQLLAEGDKSQGVLLSSGYIAGGTLAGVIFAFLNIPLKERLDQFEAWSTKHNPFFEKGLSLPFKLPYWDGTISADLLGMLPFIVLMVVLYLVGREALLGNRSRARNEL